MDRNDLKKYSEKKVNADTLLEIVKSEFVGWYQVKGIGIQDTEYDAIVDVRLKDEGIHAFLFTVYMEANELDKFIESIDKKLKKEKSYTR